MKKDVFTRAKARDWRPAAPGWQARRDARRARAKRATVAEVIILRPRRRLKMSVSQLATAVAVWLGRGMTLAAAAKAVAQATGHSPKWAQACFTVCTPLKQAA